MKHFKGEPIDERSRYSRMVGDINAIKDHLQKNGIPFESVELTTPNTIRIVIQTNLLDWWANRIKDRELTSCFWILPHLGSDIIARLW